MPNPTEIALSLDMIEKAKRRLEHQRAAVGRLRFDTDPRHAEIAREMEAAMEAKLARLVGNHAALMARA